MFDALRALLKDVPFWGRILLTPILFVVVVAVVVVGAAMLPIWMPMLAVYDMIWGERND